MLPGYHNYTKAVALKQVYRPPDIPSPTLATGDSELLQPIIRGTPVLSQPAQTEYAQVTAGGVLIGQTYEGTAGFGNLVPMVAPGDIPYYGPWTGGE